MINSLRRTKAAKQTVPTLFKISLIISLLFFMIIILSCEKMSNFERGKIFMELKDYDNAAKSFDLAVWDRPDNPDVRYHFAQALEKQGERRKAYNQYLISARIGSKEISNRLSDRAWELYENDIRDAHEFAKLAIIAHEKNAKAQFIYGYQNGYSGLPFLRDALNWSSDKKIIEATFELLKNQRYLLTPAFIEQITFRRDKYEDYGPVLFNPINNEMIWVRSFDQWIRGSRQREIALYSKAEKDTTFRKLTNLSSYFINPVLSEDGKKVYYSANEKIQLYDRIANTTTRLMKGIFPDFSSSSNLLVYTNDWNIYLSDSAATKVKTLKAGRRYYEFNFMPRFVPPRDSLIIFLSYRRETRKLDFVKTDTSGKFEKKVASFQNNFNDDRPYSYSYDISPDGNNIVFSRNNRIFTIDIETGKEDTLNLYGAYPTFSPDGKKLAIFTREYGETGEVALVDLEDVKKSNEFFEKNKSNRGKMRKLLKKATKNMEKESFQEKED